MPEGDTIHNAALRVGTALVGAEIVEIADVGHLIHYETPEPAAAAIRTFISRTSPPADAGTR